MKNIMLLVFLALIASQAVFSQSVSIETPDIYDYDIITYSSSYINDYTGQDRITMGVLNMFFGLGSLLNGHKSGWFIMGVETAGVIFIVAASIRKTSEKQDVWGGWDKGWHQETVTKENNMAPEMRKNVMATGFIVVGSAVVLGYLFPFLYHKPGSSRISQSNIPFDIELASAGDGTINGVSVCYTVKY